MVSPRSPAHRRTVHAHLTLVVTDTGISPLAHHDARRCHYAVRLRRSELLSPSRTIPTQGLRLAHLPELRRQGRCSPCTLSVEDGVGVDGTAAHEANHTCRAPPERAARTYLKHGQIWQPSTLVAQLVRPRPPRPRASAELMAASEVEGVRRWRARADVPPRRGVISPSRWFDPIPLSPYRRRVESAPIDGCRRRPALQSTSRRTPSVGARSPRPLSPTWSIPTSQLLPDRAQSDLHVPVSATAERVLARRRRLSVTRVAAAIRIRPTAVPADSIRGASSLDSRQPLGNLPRPSRWAPLPMGRSRRRGACRDSDRAPTASWDYKRNLSPLNNLITQPERPTDDARQLRAARTRPPRFRRAGPTSARSNCSTSPVTAGLTRSTSTDPDPGYSNAPRKRSFEPVQPFVSLPQLNWA